MSTGSKPDRIASLEEIVGRDVGRNIEALVESASGGLLGAARSIAEHPHPVVAIMTGFFVHWAEPAAAETDGPVGSAELAVGLAASGATVRLVTDSDCAEAVSVALAAAGASEEIPVDVVPVTGGDAIERLISRYRDDVGVTHMIAVERLGPGADGCVFDMSGRDVTGVTAPLHELFSAGDWIGIGVGDGGNEIGMGALSPEIVARNVSLGARIHCTVACDHLIVSGTSNWGAEGLLAAVAILDEEQAPSLLAGLSPERNGAILDETVAKGPAVDGVTQTQEESVDGLPAVEHAEVVRRILEVADQTK